MSTLPRILQFAYSIPRGSVGSTSEHDRIIKLFCWRDEHFSHMYCPELYEVPGRTPNPLGDDTLISDYDSLREMFSFGWGLCGENHAQFRPIAEEAGFQHRRRNLSGDTGQELYENGHWAYVNTDQYTLHFLSNNSTADFASVDQVITAPDHYIEWNPDLGGGYFLPQANTHGNYATFTGHLIPSIPLRSLQWRGYYNTVWTGTIAGDYPMYAEGYYSTPIVYRLKRGETFTRWEKPGGIVSDLGLASRAWWGCNYQAGPHVDWSFVQNAPCHDQTTNPPPETSNQTGGADWGNGCYDWQPDLASGEYMDGVVASTGTFVNGGTPLIAASTSGSLTFEFTSPYTMCGRPTANNTTSGYPDPALHCDSGAMLYTTHVGTVSVDISTDMGATWTALGSLADTMDFTDDVKGRNTYLLRLTFASGAGLNSFHTRTLTMLGQSVYPDLKSGTCTVTYGSTRTGMLDLSPDIETAAAAGSTTGCTTKVSDSGLTYDGYNSGTFAYKQAINTGIWIIYKVALPANLVSQGATFNQIFAAENAFCSVPPNVGTVGNIEISTSASGPWTTIGAYTVPTDNQLSAFWTYGRSPDGSSLGGTTYYVRFFANNGNTYNQLFRFFHINATYNLPTSTSPLNVTYFWNNGSEQSSSHQVAAGATSDSWTITTGTVAAQEKVVFSVPSGGVAAPTIVTQPANQTVTRPATATFGVAATGSGLTYQWKRGGADIAGATSATFTTGPTTVSGDNGAQFTVLVSNAGGSVLSSIATLTVNPPAVPPTITMQPADQTVTAGATATFTVVATGATGYQWNLGGTPITGATSASYTTPITTTGDSGDQFTVLVSNSYGSVLSNIATLTVNPVTGAPVIVSQPVPVTVTAPATATFSVTATGAVNYQWQKNAVNITGATGDSYTTPATTTADSGESFRVLVSNADGTTTSANAILTVLPNSGVNPISIGVGSVLLGAPTGSTVPVTTSVTLTNSSGSPITVTGSTDASWLTAGTVTVPAGGTATLVLVATPSGVAGTTSGTLTLTNSSGGTQTIPVTLAVGEVAGLRARSCAIGSGFNPDFRLWLFGLAGLAVLSIALHRRRSNRAA
ncbi:MAG: hypothetical protein ACREJ2_02875 [Planctomycetota bacterium]